MVGISFFFFISFPFSLLSPLTIHDEENLFTV